jgi:hypothetical protein
MAQVQAWGLKLAWVTGDSWYSGVAKELSIAESIEQ